jgi:preprotein translocase subunit YajC
MTLVELLPFAAIAAAFWLLIIRPASVRRKAQAALVASLAPGQRVMTTAGVFGTIVAIDAERVSVEVAPGVVIEMLAAAIAQVVPGDPAADTDAERPAEDRPVLEASAAAPADLPPAGDTPGVAPALEPPALDPSASALTPEVDRG